MGNEYAVIYINPPWAGFSVRTIIFAVGISCKMVKK
jgi:hypothetical protein